MARCLIGDRKFADARKLLDGAPKEAAGHVAVSGAKAALALAEEAGELGDPRDLQARIEADPEDHQARYRLATAPVPARPGGDRDGAPGAHRQERPRLAGRPRPQAAGQFFDALGPKDPATLKGRRMLSTVLFS